MLHLTQPMVLRNLPPHGRRPNMPASPRAFQPVALETLGFISPLLSDFLREVRWQLNKATGDVRETAYLFQ